jgi:NAD(P)-dependent dehydrogenase (short-subunit alcohol dehydrogenase family)
MYSPRGVLALLTWVVALLWSHAVRFSLASHAASPPADALICAQAAALASLRRRAVPDDSMRFAADDAVLVTGASSGLGAAVAAQLAARGAHVVLTAPCVARADAAAEAVRRAGGTATPLVLRQRTAAGVAAFAAQLDAAAAAGGWRLRAVVLNAATFAVSPAGHNDTELDGVDDAASSRLALHASLAVNHLGAWRVANAVAPRLAPGGRLVVVGSFTHRCVSAATVLAWLRRPHAMTPAPADAYALSKAALGAAVAAEHAGGTACFVVADPGLVDTRLTRAWPAAMAAFARIGGAATWLMRPPEEAAGVVLAALAVPEEEARQARPPLYLFGAGGARLRPGAAGGGDADVALAVLAATRELDERTE